MTAHGEANRQSPTARRQPTETAESKIDRYPDLPSAACSPRSHSRLPGDPGAALRTCRTDLVAQVWYNMLVSHRFTPEGGRSLPAPRHSGAGRWQAVAGAKRTPLIHSALLPIDLTM